MHHRGIRLSFAAISAETPGRGSLSNNKARRFIMIRLMLSIVLAFGGLAAAQAVIKEGPVEYKAGDTMLKGYLVYDDTTKERRPGVLVVHERWGHNQLARNS